MFLGMRRLSIIEPRRRLAADLERGLHLLRREQRRDIQLPRLRPQLEAKGHAFRTRSDSEVILHAYEEWGVECLKRFNGMLRWPSGTGGKSGSSSRATGSGRKPLYYYTDGARLVFASEIKAILASPGVPGKLRMRGLANFLGFGHSVAPETMYEGISKLLPGHYLTASEGCVKIVEYWDCRERTAARKRRGAERRRLRGENSGAARRLRPATHGRGCPAGRVPQRRCRFDGHRGVDEAACAGPVKTFSLGFTIGGAYDELSDAEARGSGKYT